MIQAHFPLDNPDRPPDRERAAGHEKCPAVAAAGQIIDDSNPLKNGDTNHG